MLSILTVFSSIDFQLYCNTKYSKLRKNLLDPKPPNAEDAYVAGAPNDDVLNENDGAADAAPNPPPSCVPSVLPKPPNAVGAKIFDENIVLIVPLNVLEVIRYGWICVHFFPRHK